jgi:hypothetical protein
MNLKVLSIIFSLRGAPFHGHCYLFNFGPGGILKIVACFHSNLFPRITWDADRRYMTQWCDAVLSANRTRYFSEMYSYASMLSDPSTQREARNLIKRPEALPCLERLQIPGQPCEALAGEEDLRGLGKNLYEVCLNNSRLNAKSDLITDCLNRLY